MNIIGATRVTQTITDPFDPTIKKIISIGRNGERVYRLDDGRVVTVWPGCLFCLRCGKPLMSKASQRKGYGPCCAKKNRSRRFPAVPVLIAVQGA